VEKISQTEHTAQVKFFAELFLKQYYLMHHTSQQVRIKGGDTPLSPKNEAPHSLLSKALLSKKTTYQK
jgi:hypothetical protein